MCIQTMLFTPQQAARLYGAQLLEEATLIGNERYLVPYAIGDILGALAEFQSAEKSKLNMMGSYDPTKATEQDKRLAKEAEIRLINAQYNLNETCRHRGIRLNK